jgi:hypothetical protein
MGLMGCAAALEGSLSDAQEAVRDQLVPSNVRSEIRVRRGSLPLHCIVP